MTALGLATSARASTITAWLSPSEVGFGASVSVTGAALEGTAPLTGAELELEASPYPYRSFREVAFARSATDGSYAFPSVRLSRNTRLRVALQAAPGTASPTLQALVDPLVRLASRSLAPGRVLLSIRLAHAAGLRSPPVSAYFYTARAGNERYELAATATTSELPGATTFASATVDPPSASFRYRVCVNPLWEAAMGPSSAHGQCPPHGFRLADAP